MDCFSELAIHAGWSLDQDLELQWFAEHSAARTFRINSSPVDSDSMSVSRQKSGGTLWIASKLRAIGSR